MGTIEACETSSSEVILNGCSVTTCTVPSEAPPGYLYNPSDSINPYIMHCDSAVCSDPVFILVDCAEGYSGYVSTTGCQTDSSTVTLTGCTVPALLVTDGWPNSFNEQGKYFGFDNDNADSFFGTEHWVGRHQIYTSDGNEGEIQVWRDNTNCQMSCGRWHPLHKASAGDWTAGITIYHNEDVAQEVESQSLIMLPSGVVTKSLAIVGMLAIAYAAWGKMQPKVYVKIETDSEI